MMLMRSCHGFQFLQVDYVTLKVLLKSLAHIMDFDDICTYVASAVI